jgi:acetyl esterase/lipase
MKKSTTWMEPRLRLAGGQQEEITLPCWVLPSTGKTMMMQALGILSTYLQFRLSLTGLGQSIFLTMEISLLKTAWGPATTMKPIHPNRVTWAPGLPKFPRPSNALTPSTYLHADIPPILIQHGRQDNLVPVQQSIFFVQALKLKVPPDRIEFEIVENAGHGDPAFETDQNMGKVFNYLDKHLLQA